MHRLIKKYSRHTKRLQKQTRRQKRLRRHTRKNTRRHTRRYLRGGDHSQFTNDTLEGEAFSEGTVISVPGIGTMGVEAYKSYVNNTDMMGSNYLS